MGARTITSPYDHQTLSELQTVIAKYKGIAWANFDSGIQTIYQRFIDDSFEWLTKTFGHEPWMKHRETFSIASGAQEFNPSLACRQIIRITETYSGQTRLVSVSTDEEYDEAWGTGAATHPWSVQTEPHYLYRGMSDDNPPKQRWFRYPIADAAITGTVLCIPYLTLIGSSGDQQYTHVPPNAAAALVDRILYMIEKFSKDPAMAGVHRQALQDEINAIQVRDNPHGAIDLNREVEVPGWASTEMSQ